MRRLILDNPEHEAARIVARIEDALCPMLDEIAAKGRALAELQVAFRFERLGDHLESIQPAAPTLVPKILLELIRLRLQAVRQAPRRRDGDRSSSRAGAGGRKTAPAVRREEAPRPRRRGAGAGPRRRRRWATTRSCAPSRATRTFPKRFAWIPMTGASRSQAASRGRAAPDPAPLRDAGAAPAARAPRARRLAAARAGARAGRQGERAVPGVGADGGSSRRSATTTSRRRRTDRTCGSSTIVGRTGGFYRERMWVRDPDVRPSLLQILVLLPRRSLPTGGADRSGRRPRPRLDRAHRSRRRLRNRRGARRGERGRRQADRRLRDLDRRRLDDRAPRHGSQGLRQPLSVDHRRPAPLGKGTSVVGWREIYEHAPDLIALWEGSAACSPKSPTRSSSGTG